MTDIAASGRPAVQAGRAFYFWMALAALAVAVIGFLPSYFMPLASGQFVAPRIVHVHGALFFSWCLFFCVQTWLVANGRTGAHRELGVLGAALASMMVLIVMVTMGVMTNFRAGFGNYEAALVFSWVQASGMIFFGACVWLAIANARQPEVHKRLMLLGTLSLLDAPIARWVGPALAMMAGAPPGPPPAGFVPPFDSVIIAGLLADILVLIAIAFDWRKLGRPHSVYLWGGALLLIMQLSREAIGSTPLWRAIAAWVAGAGGV